MSQKFTSNFPSGSSISIPSASTAAFTLCGWAYLGSTSGSADVVYADTNGGNAFNTNDAWLGLDAGNWVWKQYANGALAYGYSQAAAATTWIHLAMVFNGATTFAYVNGAQVNSAGTSVGPRAVFNFADTGGDTDITLQDVKVFTVALTAGMVTREMRFSKPCSNGLYLWWPLLNGNATKDLSANGHTLSGSGNSNGTVFAPSSWAGQLQSRALRR